MSVQRTDRGGGTLIALLVAAALLSYVNRQAPTLLVEPLRRDLGLDDIQISLLIGASFAIVYAVSSMAFGWLADRFSRTRIIGFAILLWSAGSLGCAFADSFWQLFGCRMLIGASEAALIPSALALIGDHYPDRRRGLMTGIFLVGVFGGAGGSIIIVGYLLQLSGQGMFAALPFADTAWRQVFMLAAIPGLMILPFFFLHRDIRTVQVNAAATYDERAPSSSWLSVALSCAALTLLAMSDNAVLAWVPSLLIRDYGMAAETVGHYLGLSLMLGGGLGVLTGGWWSDRRADRPGGRLIICLGATILAFPAMLTLLSGVASLIVIGVGLYLLLSSAASCAGIAALMAITSADRRGLIMSILTLSTVALGFSIGPSLTVVLAQALGGLTVGLLVMSLSCLTAASLLFSVQIVRARA